MREKKKKLVFGDIGYDGHPTMVFFNVFLVFYGFFLLGFLDVMINIYAFQLIDIDGVSYVINNTGFI